MNRLNSYRQYIPALTGWPRILPDRMNILRCHDRAACGRLRGITRHSVWEKHQYSGGLEVYACLESVGSAPRRSTAGSRLNRHIPERLANTGLRANKGITMNFSRLMRFGDGKFSSGGWQ